MERWVRLAMHLDLGEAMGALVLHGKWMPHIQLPDIGRLMWSVILPPPESLIHTTRAQRQSQFTPIFMSAPPPASRQACLSCCPPPSSLPAEIHANYREGLAASAELGLILAQIAQNCELSLSNEDGDWP